MEINKLKLSKILSYALRHAPSEYSLELDINGWANLKILINNLNEKHPELGQIISDDIINVINDSPKKRVETIGDKIRALYGHSIHIKIKKNVSIPPYILYHGTSFRFSRKIKIEGLKKMNRQYVHLTEDKNTAKIIAKRKAKNIILLRINAILAHKEGVSFFKEKDVWLAKYIPSRYIL